MPESDLKVCLVNDSFPPIIDGVANAVYNYADIITKHGGKVVVATPKYPDVRDDYPFSVIRYASVNTTKLVGYRAGYPFDMRSLGRLQDARCDVIHSHCPVSSTLLARTLRELTDAPVIFTYHTKFDIDIANAIKLKVLRDSSIKLLVRNIEACDEVWTVSHGAGENLRQLGFSGEIRVMENGVDFKKGKAPEEDCRALRSQHGIDQDTPVFLFVGRMMWYKGIHIILDGLKAASERGADFRMVFVGGGADADAIRDEAERLGLSPRCVFVGPVLDRQKIACYFSMADLFLFPSTFDTNGIVVREAAACGLPSVLVRGSCAAEGIDDGETGILIDENAGALAAAVADACADRARLRAIGERAMERIYISWEDSVNKARQRYGVVLENYRSGRTERRPMASDTVFLGMAELMEQMEPVLRLWELAAQNRETVARELSDSRARAASEMEKKRRMRDAFAELQREKRPARLPRADRYL